TLLLVALAIWAITSSALRSPPWALLARYAAAPRLPWLSTLTLSGSAIAAALAPYLGVALRDADPRLPFLLSGLTLLATVGGLLVLATAGAVGAIATLAAALAPSLGMLIAAQLIAGGCWGAANVAAFSAVIGVGRSAREGTLLGSLFAVFALAAFVRIAMV